MSDPPPPTLDYQRPLPPPRNQPLGGPAARFGVGAGLLFFVSTCIISTASRGPIDLFDGVCFEVIGTPILIGIYAAVFMIAAMFRRATARGWLVERGRFQTHLTGALALGVPILLFVLPDLLTRRHSRSDDDFFCTMAASFLFAAASPWVVFSRRIY